MTGDEDKHRKIVACPFCNNSEEGCCYCDHTGRVYEDTIEYEQEE